MPSSEMKVQNILSYENLEGYAKIIGSKLASASYQPDLIIGVARGGSIPAAMLALELKKWFNHPAWQIGTIFASSYEGQGKGRRLAIDIPGNIRALMHVHKKVLIVDDIYDSGDTIGAINYQLRGTRMRTDIRIATFLSKDDQGPDFYGHLITKPHVDEWVVFPWEQ